MTYLEPAHNVTVYRCAACLFIVAQVPPGFTAIEEDLRARAEAHNLLAHTTLELTVAGQE